MEELLLRIQVFLKHNKSLKTKESLIKLGKYQFHHTNMELVIGEKIIRLTKKRKETLRMLLARQGKLIKRETLLISIWGKDDYFYGRSMDVYISRIRKT